MKRREFLKLSLGTAAAASLPLKAQAQAGIKEIRVGYQKTGVLVIARQQADAGESVLPPGKSASSGSSSPRDRRCWKR